MSLSVITGLMLFLLSSSGYAQITSAPPAMVIHPPAYSTARIAQTVRMTCAAYGVPTPTITWSRTGSGAALNVNDPNVNIYSQSLTVNGTAFAVSILEICGVTNQAHTGEYSCSASNGVNGVGITAPSARFFLSVSTAPPEPPAIVVRPPSNVTADYGSTVEAVCVAYGNPVPAVTWTGTGCDLSTNNGSSTVRTYSEVVTFNGVSFRKSVLQLCNLKETDSSWYSCQAYNGIEGGGLAAKSWSWQLSVNPSPPPSTSSVMMMSSSSSMMMMMSSSSSSMSSMTPSPTLVGNTAGLSSNQQSVFIGIMILEAVFVAVLIVALVGVSLFAFKMASARHKQEHVDIPNAPKDPRVRIGVENPLHSDTAEGLDEYEVGGSMTYADLARKIEESDDKDPLVLPDD